MSKIEEKVKALVKNFVEDGCWCGDGETITVDCANTYCLDCLMDNIDTFYQTIKERALKGLFEEIERLDTKRVIKIDFEKSAIAGLRVAPVGLVRKGITLRGLDYLALKEKILGKGGADNAA